VSRGLNDWFSSEKTIRRAELQFFISSHTRHTVTKQEIQTIDRDYTISLDNNSAATVGFENRFTFSPGSYPLIRGPFGFDAPQ